MIRIGLIGTGFMGQMHGLVYEALKDKLDFQLTAVADDNEDKAREAADKFGAAVYGSAAELIERADVDAVDICLPTYLHKEAAIHAMNKGLDVFIEKPVCLYEGEAAELLEAQARTGAKVMIGHCIRFWPEYMELRRMVEDRRYGEVLSASFRRLSPKPAWAWRGWMDDPAKSGTASLDLHIHDVDFVRSLFGEPDRLRSEAVYRKDSDSHIFSLYKYGNAAISLEGGWDFPSSFPFEMGYRVRFEEAAVCFSSTANPPLVIYEDSGRVEERTLEEAAGAGGAAGGNIASLGGYYNELRYFVERLIAGQQIEEATLAEGVESLRLTLREIAEANQQL